MMKRALCMAAAAAMSASATMAADLHLDVQSGGLNAITVAPGATVNYEILGLLSTDADNEGLALFGLTLTFDGGDLPPADVPAGPSSVVNPMPSFVRTEGITNPDSPCPPACGFGGTIIGGDLVQIGGGQNTILNTVANAPFPIGGVITGLGHAEMVLVTGSLTAPAADGVYNLVILPDAFANVIMLGETGTPFWATTSVGAVTSTGLVITVEPVGGDANLASSNPACEVSWPRSANNFAFLTFDADLTAPTAGQVQIRELLAGGGFGTDLSSGFTITVQNDGAAFPRVLTVRENGTQLVDRKWYAISNNGWGGVSDFEVDIVHLIGDADGNGRVLGADVGSINSQISPLPQVDSRMDTDGNGRVLGADVGLANSKISPLAVPKPSGHLCVP